MKPTPEQINKWLEKCQQSPYDYSDVAYIAQQAYAAGAESMKRGAPCERFCEANAFNIEIRQLKRYLEETQEALRNLKAERDALQAQLEAMREQEQIGWLYDAATYPEGDLRGRQWKHNVFSTSKPYTENNMVRNLRPVFAHPAPPVSAEPVAYLAWKDGKPCYEGDDAVCEDAVWPVDFDDDRTSMPVYTHPAPDHTATGKQSLQVDHTALLRQALEAFDDPQGMPKLCKAMDAIREQLK